VFVEYNNVKKSHKIVIINNINKKWIFADYNCQFFAKICEKNIVEVYIQTAKIGCLRKLAKIVFRGIPIFAVNFAQTFLQCPPLLPHGVLGSNLAFEQNRNFAEFFAVYLENRVFRPHQTATMDRVT
jgi:hypothetical protein